LEATSKTCRQCGGKFIPAFRAGRNSGQRRQAGERAITLHGAFCSKKCRQANYRWRLAQGSPVTGDSTAPFSAVTRPLQNIENIEEKVPLFRGARPQASDAFRRLQGDAVLSRWKPYVTLETDLPLIPDYLRRDRM